MKTKREQLEKSTSKDKALHDELVQEVKKLKRKVKSRVSTYFHYYTNESFFGLYYFVFVFTGCVEIQTTNYQQFLLKIQK